MFGAEFLPLVERAGHVQQGNLLLCSIYCEIWTPLGLQHQTRWLKPPDDKSNYPSHNHNRHPWGTPSALTVRGFKKFPQWSQDEFSMVVALIAMSGTKHVMPSGGGKGDRNRWVTSKLIACYVPSKYTAPLLKKVQCHSEICLMETPQCLHEWLGVASLYSWRSDPSKVIAQGLCCLSVIYLPLLILFSFFFS